MDYSLLGKGFLVMFLGMGTVFFFLTVLVLVVDLVSKILAKINKYFPEEDTEKKKTTLKTSKNEDETIAVAILKAMISAKKI